MITIKELKWDNWFSYGDNNSINFNDVKLTQLKGKNGRGKSSIPLILEEILYGKNSKGIKKQDLANRYSDSASIKATLFFDVDDDEYEITLIRKSTIKLTLIKNGIDISSHKSPDTYKTIESILGLDFKTFCQLVYQSSTSSLQFLTSTDTQRKKFLITLLLLETYSKLHEEYKLLYREKSKDIASISGSLSTIKSWINKNTNTDLKYQELIEEIELPTDEKNQLAELTLKLKDIVKTNNSINKNNQYKQSLDKIDKQLLELNLIEPEDISNHIKRKTELDLKIKTNEKLIEKIKSLDNKCPTCYQDISKYLKQDYLDKLNKKSEGSFLEAKKLRSIILQHSKDKSLYNKQQEAIKDFEMLTNFIDENLDNKILDASELNSKIIALEKSIDNITKTKLEIDRKNVLIEKNNTKLGLIEEQLHEYNENYNKVKEKLSESTSLGNSLEIIKDSFSTNGLVSYKIESLVKDLEIEINKYLAELSSGRFQLYFGLKGEKLNIDIIDDNNKITIDALSDGELARVNVATLLAIRKMMSALSSTKINLLFLDEVYGVLDKEGKDTLSEILLKEDLNTFLVAHDYSHPLMNVIDVIKENNISRLEW